MTFELLHWIFLLNVPQCTGCISTGGQQLCAHVCVCPWSGRPGIMTTSDTIQFLVKWHMCQGIANNVQTLQPHIPLYW